ncbi:unnamed protein product [Meganyctiphanes norvegica]|uniref:N-acetyltransferase domain-containing protein n=1 Tax=Meganyctiphanes norvegica TaxID=48144 RepID=A0AAV2QY55_MEGNR
MTSENKKMSKVETKMPEKDILEYGVVSKKDAEQIWPLLSKAFFPREPIIRMTRAVLSHLEASFNVFKAEKVDKVGEMAMLTVDPKYAGRGIARKLVQMAEDLLVKKGITIAYSQATNIVSHKVFTKCGYETRLTIDFEPFELNGKRILDLSKMEGTTKAAIVTKNIGISKENKL